MDREGTTPVTAQNQTQVLQDRYLEETVSLADPSLPENSIQKNQTPLREDSAEALPSKAKEALKKTRSAITARGMATFRGIVRKLELGLMGLWRSVINVVSMATLQGSVKGRSAMTVDRKAI